MDNNIQPINPDVGVKVREVIQADPDMMVIRISKGGAFYLGTDLTRRKPTLRIADHAAKKHRAHETHITIEKR